MIFRLGAVCAVLLVVLGIMAAGVATAEKERNMMLAKAMTKEYPVKDVIIDKPYYSMHRDFATYGFIGGFTFCGVDIKAEADGDKITLTWGGDQTKEIKKSGTTVEIISGEDKHTMCVVKDDVKGWGYFNATVKETKLEKGTVRFFDMNCDGKYLEEKVDALMYGDRAFVSPIMPVQWYYDWDVKFEFFMAKKPMIKVEYKPIEIFPDERAAGVVLNEFRMDMGLPAVPIDAVLSKKARLYAKFITLNGADMADWNIIQNPAPGHLGYTPECEEMKRSYFFCFDDAPTAMADMMSQFYHRSQFFFPDTKQFAIGADGPTSVFNGELTRDPEYIKWNYPITVPGAEQTIKTMEYYGKYGGETPNPVPGGAGGSFPISLIWESKPEELKVKSYGLYIVEGKKEKEVESFCFWPGRPAVPSYPDNEGQILIMASKPYKRGSRYKVSVTYTINGKEETKEWYFNTSKK
ncbi:MAG: hypothetical protein Kow00107_03430 [Planctomycetota bacterium]